MYQEKSEGFVFGKRYGVTAGQHGRIKVRDKLRSNQIIYDSEVRRPVFDDSENLIFLNADELLVLKKSGKEVEVIYSSGKISGISEVLRHVENIEEIERLGLPPEVKREILFSYIEAIEQNQAPENVRTWAREYEDLLTSVLD